MRIIICFTLLFSFNVHSQSGLVSGSGTAPDITVNDIFNNSHNLYDYLDSGYVVVLDFLSVTCGHCLFEY